MLGRADAAGITHARSTARTSRLVGLGASSVRLRGGSTPPGNTFSCECQASSVFGTVIRGSGAALATGATGATGAIAGGGGSTIAGISGSVGVRSPGRRFFGASGMETCRAKFA
ncbi:MAG: hypothetical protein H6Q89_2502 [Myxococcaceae bacterium]|nr:hypothetical protein [Myxococcaceae bacterium]